MSDFKYSVEIIDGVKYFTTLSARGVETMIFTMCGNTFLQIGRKPATHIDDVKKFSSHAKKLLEVFNG